jgi:hypothetical protein
VCVMTVIVGCLFIRETKEEWMNRIVYLPI